MSIAGLLGGLGTAIDAFEIQQRAQQQMQLGKLDIARSMLELQHAQQQSQIDLANAKIDGMQAQAKVADQNQPDPSSAPYSVQQFGGGQPGGQQGGGPIPTAQPMQGGPPGSIGGGTGMPQDNPLLGPASAQRAPQQAPPQQQPTSAADQLAALQPPTPQSIAQGLMQRAQAAGLDPNSPVTQMAIKAKTATAYQQAMEGYKAQQGKLEVLARIEASRQEHAETEADRRQFHQDSEADRAASRGIAAAGLASRNQSKGWDIFQQQDGTLLRINKDTGETEPVQGAKNVSKVGGGGQPRSATAALLAAHMREHPNESAEGIQKFLADNKAIMAGEQSLGTRSANVELLGREIENMAPILLESSERVDRTEYPSLNKVIEATRQGTGDTNVTRLGVSVSSLVDIYARYLNPTGAATDQGRQQAMSILTAAYSKNQMAAAVDQMKREIGAGRSAAKDAQQSLTGGKSAQPPAATGDKADDFYHLWK